MNQVNCSKLKRDDKGRVRILHWIKEDELLEYAASIARDRVSTGLVFDQPERVSSYLTPIIGSKLREVFVMLHLDVRHRLICLEDASIGTIDGATVHPREVVKSALANNAAAVIFAHNHPSGIAEPSQADINLTKRLKDALLLVDIRVLDHIVVTATESVSLASRGLF